MFSTFFKFELRVGQKSPMPWIFLAIIALFCFGGTISDQISIGGSFGNVHKNAPFVAQNFPLPSGLGQSFFSTTIS